MSLPLVTVFEHFFIIWICSLAKCTDNGFGPYRILCMALLPPLTDCDAKTCVRSRTASGMHGKTLNSRFPFSVGIRREWEWTLVYFGNGRWNESCYTGREW